MKAYYSAKCWAFGFNGHCSILAEIGFRSWGSLQSYSKASSLVQSHEKQELWKYGKLAAIRELFSAIY